MISYELSADYNIYPHLTVWNRLQDGRPAGFRINVEDGFVFYDPAAVCESNADMVANEEIPVQIYYARVRYLPRNYEWNKFGLRVVKEVVR